MKKEKATWVEPISVPFKGYRVWELPPNNQGVAVLEMLRVLDADDLPRARLQLPRLSPSTSSRPRSSRMPTSRNTSAIPMR